MGGECSLFLAGGPLLLLLGHLLGVLDLLLWLVGLVTSHLLGRCFLWASSLSFDADRLHLSLSLLLSSMCRWTSTTSFFLLVSPLCFGFFLAGEGDRNSEPDEEESDLLLLLLALFAALSFDLDLLCLSFDLDLRVFSGRFAFWLLSLVSEWQCLSRDLDRLFLSPVFDLRFLSCDLDLLLLLWLLSWVFDC